jgi:hypothetical protein
MAMVMSARALAAFAIQANENMRAAIILLILLLYFMLPFPVGGKFGEAGWLFAAREDEPALLYSSRGKCKMIWFIWFILSVIGQLTALERCLSGKSGTENEPVGDRRFRGFFPRRLLSPAAIMREKLP